ncbi:hypothetical protein [uncultured Clostridium sp.]|uniref:hypothetical protein n=1 Tax=uncultured Clostridium sp. TaxID=59620 RepID=UPI0026DB183A|nr:hypothetical protein [uncultured Clostridium sp.]
MKMNNNLEKVCRFLIENKVSDKDLIVGFDENLVIYKDFEWDLNSKYTEVEVNEYDEIYEELVIEDCDQYKLTIYWDGTIEVETPGDETELEELRRENSELLYKIEMLEEANKDLADIIKNKSETDIAEKDDVIKRYIDTDEFKALLENLKFIEENVDLFNGIYVDIPKIGVR